jgi:hypothetical protein
LASEVDVLARTSHEVMSRFEQAIARAADKKRQSALRRVASQNRKAMQRQVRELYRLATLVSRRTGVAG